MYSPLAELPAFESLGVLSEESAQRIDTFVDAYGFRLPATGEMVFRAAIHSRDFAQRLVPPHLSTPFMLQDDFWSTFNSLYDTISARVSQFSDQENDLIDYRKGLLQPGEVQGRPGWHFDMFGDFIAVSFVAVDTVEDEEELTTRNAVGSLTPEQAEELDAARITDEATYLDTYDCPTVDRLTNELLQGGTLNLKNPAAKSRELMVSDGRHLHSTAPNTTNQVISRTHFRFVRVLPTEDSQVNNQVAA